MKKTLLTCLLMLFISISGYTQITFNLHSINSTGANPYVMDSGHLNADAYPDIVVGTLTGGTVEIYINNGDGTFATPIIISLSQVNGIHIADLDDMNGNDILASSFDGDKLVWYANNGDGTFGTEQNISTSVDGPGTIVTGKIDAGDTIDIALVVYGGDGDTDRVIWFANDGLPWTEQDIVPAAAGMGPGDLDIADFDGDTDLDIVVANTDGKNVELYYNNLFGSGTVSFTKDANSVSTGNIYLFDISFGDVNDDMAMDILKVDLDDPGEIAWYKKEMAGTFTETIVTSSHIYPSTAFVVDLNDDTYNDVVAVDGLNQNDDAFWFESTNIGTLGSETLITDNQAHNQIYNFTINDFDNDGDLDLATIGYQDHTLKWLENDLIVLGIDDNSINQISIYPNPTSDKLHFKGPFTQDFNVSVFDVLGKKVKNATLKTNNPLDVSQLHNGIYFIRFEDYNTTFKFIKE